MIPKGTSILGNLHLKEFEKKLFLYYVYFPKTSISDINADDNGVYLISRNTKKFYFCDNDQTNIVCEYISGKSYYNQRLSRNSYKNVYITSDKIIKLSRTYTKPKSFALTRNVIKVSNPASDPPSPFVAVFYQASAIAEEDEVSCHGNATQNSKPCFWTSKDVFQKAREKCVNGLNAKTVHDKINKLSGGVYSSSSQSSELRDTRQVHRRKEKAKTSKRISTQELAGHYQQQ